MPDPNARWHPLRSGLLEPKADPSLQRSSSAVGITESIEGKNGIPKDDKVTVRNGVVNPRLQDKTIFVAYRSNAIGNGSPYTQINIRIKVQGHIVGNRRHNRSGTANQ